MSKRIYFAILAMLIHEITSDSAESCQNGGESSSGVCVCPPEYTGVVCDVKIDAKNETIKGFETCLSNSGSGTESGSGYEIDTIDDCDDPKQIRFENECRLFSQFEGSVTWNSTQELQDLNDTSSSNYVTVTKTSNCALKKIFENHPVGEITIEEILGEISGIEIRFIIKTSIATGLPEITTWLQSARNRYSDAIIKFQVRDYDECKRLTHDCHPVAKCLNSDGSYRCECPVNYTAATENGKRPGSLCHHICKDEFEEDYCFNAAVCSVTMDQRAICECPLGFAGRRCEQNWAVYFYATIGLAASFGLFIVIIAMVGLMLWARPALGPPKTQFQTELENRLQNGDKNIKKKRPRDIKGISNPYVSAEEGITVPTKVEITDEGRVNSSDEEDRL